MVVVMVMVVPIVMMMVVMMVMDHHRDLRHGRRGHEERGKSNRQQGLHDVRLLSLCVV
jgi:hypothetical protein